MVYLETKTIDARVSQRWAPGAYNPRALGVSLGISGHRTDLVQGNISTRPGSRSYRASTHLRRIENGQEVSSDRADRVDCLKYPAEIDRAVHVTRRSLIKLK